MYRVQEASYQGIYTRTLDYVALLICPSVEKRSLNVDLVSFVTSHAYTNIIAVPL
jgi:hypothetical protein